MGTQPTEAIPAHEALPPMEDLQPKPALSPPRPAQVRRIIDFSASTYRVLEELATGESIGEALRDAIALSKWFKDTREAGARILVERNGRLREVITIKYPPER
jgi:hypothetical protein